MNEAETRAELIDPALKAAGWGVVEASRVRREVIAPGRLEGSGRRAKAEDVKDARWASIFLSGGRNSTNSLELSASAPTEITL